MSKMKQMFYTRSLNIFERKDIMMYLTSNFQQLNGPGRAPVTDMERKNVYFIS